MLLRDLISRAVGVQKLCGLAFLLLHLAPANLEHQLLDVHGAGFLRVVRLRYAEDSVKRDVHVGLGLLQVYLRLYLPYCFSRFLAQLLNRRCPQLLSGALVVYLLALLQLFDDGLIALANGRRLSTLLVL